MPHGAQPAQHHSPAPDRPQPRPQAPSHHRRRSPTGQHAAPPRAPRSDPRPPPAAAWGSLGKRPESATVQGEQFKCHPPAGCTGTGRAVSSSSWVWVQSTPTLYLCMPRWCPPCALCSVWDPQPAAVSCHLRDSRCHCGVHSVPSPCGWGHGCPWGYHSPGAGVLVVVVEGGGGSMVPRERKG